MHLKRYRSQTVKDALQAVRAELGPDALVLSSRTVLATGVRGLLGKREIEITAAAERHAASEDRHPPSPSGFGAASPSPVGFGAAGPSAPGFGGVAARDPRSAPTRKRALRPRSGQAERAVHEIAARLQATGLDASLAAHIAAKHPVNRRRGANLEGLKDTLAMELMTLAVGDETYAPVEVFVGPPGVGKTTTIAKIAAQERARHGQRLGLLSADGFRVGAIEQLRLYADILGAPFEAARTPDEFSRVLADVRRPLLVDTAGRSPSDDVSKDMFRVLASRDDVRTHLVIPASTTPRGAERLFERFADARPTRVALTRLDEAESIGALVSVLRERGVLLSYLGTGQNVPADLQRATPPVLADWIMGEMTTGAVA
jgi:flagellar biosynthesis protein FlhF